MRSHGPNSVSPQDVPRRRLGKAEYIAEILDCADFVLQTTHDLEFSSYRQSRLIRRSVEHSLFVMGRSIGRLASEDDSMAARLGNWQLWVRFGKRLLHEYYDVDDVEVWEFVQAFVPELKGRIEVLIREGTDI